MTDNKNAYFGIIQQEEKFPVFSSKLFQHNSLSKFCTIKRLERISLKCILWQNIISKGFTLILYQTSRQHVVDMLQFQLNLLSPFRFPSHQNNQRNQKNQRWFSLSLSYIQEQFYWRCFAFLQIEIFGRLLKVRILCCCSFSGF